MLRELFSSFKRLSGPKKALVIVALLAADVSTGTLVYKGVEKIDKIEASKKVENKSILESKIAVLRSDLEAYNRTPSEARLSKIEKDFTVLRVFADTVIFIDDRNKLNDDINKLRIAIAELRSSN